jgi:transmembrane sensor
LADAAENEAAFELLTDTWEKSALLRRRPLERVASWERAGFRIGFLRAGLATAATAIVAITGTLIYLNTDAVATGKGELRTLTLEDGSRVQLNSKTRIAVHYEKKIRRVALERGEAVFEVAKRPDWPFVVTSGGRDIRALGTTFIVRHKQQNLTVTLVEGKVTVSPAESVSAWDLVARPVLQRSSETIAGTFDGQVLTLSPGERVSFVGAGTPQIDRPPLERITAWEHGQVVLDNTRLADAITEVNEYSTVQIAIDDPVLSGIQVSGVWRAGDSVNFALAIARTYRLKAIHRGDEIILTRQEP